MSNIKEIKQNEIDQIYGGGVSTWIGKGIDSIYDYAYKIMTSDYFLSAVAGGLVTAASIYVYANRNGINLFTMLPNGYRNVVLGDNHPVLYHGKLGCMFDGTFYEEKNQ